MFRLLVARSCGLAEDAADQASRAHPRTVPLSPLVSAAPAAGAAGLSLARIGGCGLTTTVHTAGHGGQQADLALLVTALALVGGGAVRSWVGHGSGGGVVSGACVPLQSGSGVCTVCHTGRWGNGASGRLQGGGVGVGGVCGVVHGGGGGGVWCGPLAGAGGRQWVTCSSSIRASQRALICGVCSKIRWNCASDIESRTAANAVTTSVTASSVASSVAGGSAWAGAGAVPSSSAARPR